MKNAFLPILLLITAAAFWSCKKESVDLNPPKRIKTIETDGSSVQTFDYDGDKRIKKITTISSGSISVTTFDYSKAGQVIQTSENNANGSVFKTVSTITLNGDGLGSSIESVSTTTTNQVVTTNSRGTTENTYNKDKNQIMQTSTSRDPTTGNVTTVTTTETTFKNKNAISQKTTLVSNGIKLAEIVNNTTFGKDKNTLGFSYRGQNFAGVASLNLATSTTSTSTNFDQNNPTKITGINESVTTNENSLDSDGFIIKRVTTNNTSFTPTGGTKQTQPTRTTTIVFTYE